jgi:barstar (barnase inhibitor)
MKYERLLHSAGPHLHLLVMTPDEATNLGWSLGQQRDEQCDGGQAVVRFLRGNKMRTAPELFDEFAAALQFPYYFGENWNAISECLADLEWLPGGACVLLIMSAPELLAREPEEVLAMFLDFLEVSAETWTAAADGPLERAPRPFHVVFQSSPEYEAPFLARVHGAGFTLDRLS